MASSPILILTWRRHHLLTEQLRFVQSYNPSAIYIYSDGPNDTASCKRDVALTREIIREAAAADCSIKTLFSTSNSGLRQSVLSALRWVFSSEDTAIILEDDVVASPAFFSFCNHYLSACKHVDNILTISGSSFLSPLNPISPKKPYLSIYSQCWGWATWKRSWDEFDSFLSSSVPPHKLANKFLFSRPLSLHSIYWATQFLKARKNHVDSWSFELTFYALLNHKYHVTPPTTLTTNVGFDEKAVHTSTKPVFLQTLEPTRNTPTLLPANQLSLSKKADRVTAYAIYNYPRSILGILMRSLLNFSISPLRLVKKLVTGTKAYSRRILLPAKLHLRDYDSLQRPLGASMGFARGLPIDRFYITNFLRNNMPTVTSRVLEFGDATLSKSLLPSGSIVDVAIYRENACAISQGNYLYLDLTTTQSLSPKHTYDLIICTQVLMCLPDPHQALNNLHSLLKPNGLLIGSISSSCAPISLHDYSRWGYYWTGTDQYVQHLLGLSPFAPDQIKSFGSFYAARAFLDGLSSEDLHPELLATDDPSYPIVTCFLARSLP